MLRCVILMINKDNFVDLLLAWYEREKQKEKDKEKKALTEVRAKTTSVGNNVNRP